MEIMCIAAIIFACLGLIGLIMNMIGIRELDISLCQYANWFCGAASGFLIALGISMMFGWVHIVSSSDYEKINKPAMLCNHSIYGNHTDRLR